MTDWKSCRVVQDKDGDLWTNYSGMWHTPEMAPFSADSLAKYDPTPVLDADGLPVVRTVGDLTARHFGRCVRVGAGSGVVYRLDLAMLRQLLRTGVNTPCEVLDFGEEGDWR